MNDTKSHVKEYLLKEKEFEDELEKLKAKIDILSAITYNRGQKDLYLKLKEERRSLEAQLNQLQSDLNGSENLSLSLYLFLLLIWFNIRNERYSISHKFRTRR
jgi:hypothetical protein